MERRNLYLRVGLLILGGIALLIALIWFLGGTQIAHGTLFESYFSESVEGLQVGSSVTYRGVLIGRVTVIGLVSAEYAGGRPLDLERQTYRLVFVRFEVDISKIGNVPDTATAVALGLRARLASQGITGLSYLELDFVDPANYPMQEVPWQPKAQYIPSMPSTLTQVQDAAQQVLAKLNRIDINKLSEQLAGLLADLRAELSNGDLHTTLQEATKLLHSTSEEIRAADLPGLTAAVRQSSDALRETLQGERMRTLLTNAGTAAARLADAAARLPPLIASFETTARRAGNSAADVEQGLVPLLRDMQATAQNLRELTEELRRYPAQALGPPPPRVAEPAR